MFILEVLPKTKIVNSKTRVLI
ncbi:protein of unknown function [Thermococcus nautili]|nr:protein of unknown function [Thermococcus nautili]